MARVRAKMYVSQMTQMAWDPGALQVKLLVVSRGEENKEWASATPSGEVTMNIKNAGAAAQFSERLGKEFWVDFTPVEDGQ